MEPNLSRTLDHRTQEACRYSALCRLGWAIEAGVDLYCARNQSRLPSSLLRRLVNIGMVVMVVRISVGLGRHEPMVAHPKGLGISAPPFSFGTWPG